MAIIFDNSATYSNNAAPVSPNVAITIAANATMLVAAVINTPDSAPVVTIGSSPAMNLLSDNRYVTKYGMSVFYYINPPTGSRLIEFRESGGGGINSPVIVVASYIGASLIGMPVTDQATPIVTGHTYSLTPASSLNDLVLHFSAIYLPTAGPTITYATGETLRVAAPITAGYMGLAEKAGAAGTTTVSVNLSDNATSYLFDVAVALTNPQVGTNSGFIPFF